MIRKTIIILCVLLISVSMAAVAARPILYWGSRGEDVTALQQRLYQWQYLKVQPTGYFGSLTAAAVRWFQAKNQLTVDGIVGPATWQALGLWWTTTTQRSTNVPVTVYEADLLARLIASEARGEPWNGMVGVGAVVVNRMKHPQFPSSLTNVAYQKYQFESVSNGLVWMRWPTQTERAAASVALAGTDPTGGALFFWNPDKPISSRWIWTRQIITRIGSHVFAI